jgi:uncharacterized protein
MSAEQNAELIRSGYEAFSKGDLDTVRELFGSGIRWHIGGKTDLAGTYTGHDEVFDFFNKIFERSGGTFAVEIHDLLASEDHVVVLAHESASREGRELSSNDAHIWHLADGKATEYWAFPEDANANDAFWE